MTADLSITTSLTLPGNLFYLEMALEFIQQSAQKMAFSTEELNRIRLASEEAVSNIMKHGLDNSLHENFTITCTAYHYHFQIAVHEKGKPFEPEKIEAYDPATLNVFSSLSGLGTFLMKQVMDEVSFRNLGRNGKETILVKYLEKYRVDGKSGLEQRGAEHKSSETPDVGFYMRPFKEEDGIGISRAAHSVYHYSYEAFIYYPSKIVEMNRKGHMLSYVVETSDSVIAGHMALKFGNNPSCAEIGVGFVRPDYRRKKLFVKLTDFVLDQANHLNQLKSIYSRCVSAHPYSQKTALQYKFSPTGIQLALFPSDVDFKGISGKVVQKDSAVSMCLTMESSDRTWEVYVPENHRAVVQEIFKNLDIDVAFNAPEPLPGRACEGTILTASIMDIFNTGDIFCQCYNNETLAEIRQMLRQFCLDRLDVIYLYLDMADPAMPHIADQCEKMGFFFSKVLPFGINGNHALVYQYLNNLTIDFDRIKVADSFSEYLKAYIAGRCSDTAF